MEPNRHIWRYWAKNLQQWGLTKWVVAILEACGPLTLVGAQVIYLGQPLLGRSTSAGHLDDLAQLLEDSSKTHAFIDYLRESDTQ